MKKGVYIPVSKLPSALPSWATEKVRAGGSLSENDVDKIIKELGIGDDDRDNYYLKFLPDLDKANSVWTRVLRKYCPVKKTICPYSAMLGSYPACCWGTFDINNFAYINECRFGTKAKKSKKISQSKGIVGGK